MKRHLVTRGPFPDIDELQGAIDAFARHCNEVRPHRSIKRMTPLVA